MRTRRVGLWIDGCAVDTTWLTRNIRVCACVKAWTVAQNFPRLITIRKSNVMETGTPVFPCLPLPRAILPRTLPSLYSPTLFACRCLCCRVLVGREEEAGKVWSCKRETEFAAMGIRNEIKLQTNREGELRDFGMDRMGFSRVGE